MKATSGNSMSTGSAAAGTPPSRRGGRPPTPINTPAEIVETIGWQPRVPIPLPRPNGVVSPASALGPRPKHKLVVLGDSISQGFRSLAISDTALSWPAMVARYGGLGPFRHPTFDAPAECPGFPLNLEAVLRGIEWPRTGADLVTETRLVRRLHELCDGVEDYWERGRGSRRISAAASAIGRRPDLINDNLACWGQDVRDAFALTMENLQYRIETAPKRGDQRFALTPSVPYERSAALTMAGARASDTCTSLARVLGEDGGIETLVVALGANNILSSVIDFTVNWTDDESLGRYDEVDHKAKFTAWTPEHFRSEYDLLLAEIDKIAAKNVIVLTVPHVTIVPGVRGVGTKMYHDRYFARYTRPWISDDQFSPNRHPCLTGDQLRVLDYAVDLYNDHIVQRVEERGADSAPDRGWLVLDLAGLLDRLAFRRYLIDDQAQPDWWTPYDLPEAFSELSPVPDTRYLGSDRFGRTQGGLISLDGVHPTTLGYSLIAREVMNAMATLGVPLAAGEPDYSEIIAADTLLSEPLPQLDSVLNGVDLINRTVDLVQALRGSPPL